MKTTTVCLFDGQTKDIIDEMTWTWLRRGHLKSETESFL